LPLPSLLQLPIAFFYLSYAFSSESLRVSRVHLILSSRLPYTSSILPVEIANPSAKANVTVAAPSPQEAPSLTPAKAFIQKLHEKRDGAAA
jgi:hypothetical protein